MKIIREKLTHKVTYLLADTAFTELTDSRLILADRIVLDVKSDTHEIITGDSPDVWVGGGILAYDNDGWAIANQTAYDAVMADREAEAVKALIATVTEAVQYRLDAFAQTRGYDSIISACTYANSTVPAFKAEGICCVSARDATWSILYQAMRDIESGVRPMPAGYSDIEPDLPALVWP